MNTATEIKVDNEGFLVNHNEWSLRFLSTAAKADDIELTDKHIDVAYCLREYYEDFSVAPPVRVLVRKPAVKLGIDVDSDYIYSLFPNGIKQAAKLAGLPKPTGCF